MKICTNVLRQMQETIGQYEEETGGLLGGKEGVITSFYFDEDSYHNSRFISCYYPSWQKFYQILDKWKSEQIKFMGIVHSHPCNYSKLSKHDIMLGKQILRLNSQLEFIYLPVMIGMPKESKLIAYCIFQNGVVYKEDISTF